jgi:hypothetical protein
METVVVYFDDYPDIFLDDLSETTLVRIAGLCADNWSRDLPNMKEF